MSRKEPGGMRRRRACAVALALLPCVGRAALAEEPAVPPREAATPVAAAVDPFAALAWLAGCWEGRDGDQVVEEQWMAPRGGTMIGMGRTVAGGRTVFHESLRIESRGGVPAYVARPAGQDETSFALVSGVGSRFVFENAAHDYPQRIIYRRMPDGSLLARIEGTRDGKSEGSDYPLRRAPCPGGRAQRGP